MNGMSELARKPRASLTCFATEKLSVSAARFRPTSLMLPRGVFALREDRRDEAGDAAAHALLYLALALL